MPRPRKSDAEKKRNLDKRRQRFKEKNKYVCLRTEDFNKLQFIAGAEEITVSQAASVVIDGYLKKNPKGSSRLRADEEFEHHLLTFHEMYCQEPVCIENKSPSSATLPTDPVLHLTPVMSTSSLLMMPDKDTILKGIKKEIIEEPEPSEELGYHTYTVKEGVLGEDWTEQSTEHQDTFTEPTSTEQPETRLVKKEPLEDDWTEDNETSGVCGEAQSKDAVKRRHHTNSLQEESDSADDDNDEIETELSGEADYVVNCVTEELSDSDDTEDDSADLQIRLQGGTTTMKNSSLGINTSNVGQHSPTPAELGTQSDSSDRESEYSSSYNYRSCNQEPSGIAEGELSGLGSSYHNRGWMDTEEERKCDYNNEINSVEDHGQSSELVSIKNKRFKCIETKNVEVLHECCICQKNFSTNAYLLKHMRLHSGEKPYMCSVCNKRFSHNSNLNRHMKIHSGEKPFQCSVCNKRWAIKRYLTVHMRTHTGEKPYQCCICNTKFSESCSLKRHMRIHTGEKPYQCSICAKFYSENSNLVKHMRIHTGEKAHQCSVCSKSFSRNSDLDRHMRIHTREKLLKHCCSVCNKAYSKNIDLKRHMRIHTGKASSVSCL